MAADGAWRVRLLSADAARLAASVFRLAYNTNGLAHHRLEDALRLLADLGYGGVALTPDVGCLDPFDLDPRRVSRVGELARGLDLVLSVETGARFLMDPARKHFPTLMEEDAADRARRVDFYRRSIDLAADLGARLLSLWSGAAPDGATADRGGSDRHWTRLCDGLESVLTHGESRGVAIAFEPEPGMFVERPAGFVELRRRLGSRGKGLGLTLDVGHLIATGDLGPPGEPKPAIGAWLREFAAELVHVHLDDAVPGVHEHLPFGRGVLDLRATLAGLREIGFGGLAAVELSRDSHRGAAMAAQTMQRLREASLGAA